MSLFVGGYAVASGNKFRLAGGDAEDAVVDGVMGNGAGFGVAGEAVGAARIDGVGGNAVED